MIQNIVIILLTILIILIYKSKQSIILALPLINIILDLSFNVFEGSGRTAIGVSVPAFYRFLIYLMIIYFFIKQLRYAKYPKYFWIFIIYLFYLCLFASDIFIALKNYSQLVFALMMFPIGFLFFDNDEKLKKFFLYSKYALSIYVISFILGNFFNIGTRVFGYSKTINESIGFIEGGGTYAGGVIVALLPLMLYFDKTKKEKIISIILCSVFIIGVILTLRRTAIIIPLIGLITFLFFARRRFKIILSIILASFIFLIISPLISDKLIQRFDARASRGKFDRDFYENEGRYYDIVSALEQASSLNKPIKAFFGTNLFAEGGWRYGEVIGRNIHNDYAVFLKGAGIVGFVLYMSMMISIFFLKGIRMRIKRVKISLINTSLIALLLIFFTVSINGGYNIISYRSVLFLLMGAFVRVLFSKTIKSSTLARA